MIALIVFTDGRHCIEETIASATEAFRDSAEAITRRVIFDDSGDALHRAWLDERFGEDFSIVWHPDGRQGFGGNIRHAWQFVRSIEEPFVFHLEDDFTFNRPLDLVAMAETLNSVSWLTQIAFRRQPWNEAERRAGGIVEANPDDFSELKICGNDLLLHRRFFTTNPCLYSRDLVERHEWPDGANSEGRFGIELFKDAEAHSAYWGDFASGEWVTHIGDTRAGSGY